MAGILKTDTIAVTLQGRIFEQTTLSTWHFRPSADFTGGGSLGADLKSICDTIIAGPPGNKLLDLFLACVGDNWEIENVRAQVINPIRSAYVAVAHTASGTGPSSASTSNLACVITKQDGLGGRSHVGSLHVPALPSDSIESGFLSALQITALENLAGTFKANLSVTGQTATLRAYLYHPKAPDTSGPILTTIVQPTVRVMRRRTVRVGI